MKHITPTFLRHFAAFITLLIAGVSALAAQPSEAQLERIVQLVEAGQISEALIRTETLLEVFPDNAELKQMASALAQQPKSAPPPPNPELERIRSALSGDTPAPAPVRVAAAREPSTMDRLEIQTVLTGAQQALQLPDAAARATRLTELLARPVPEAALQSTHAEWLVYWQTRTIAALETDNLTYGWQAVQALKRLGALESKDPQLNQLIVAANLKGWLAMDEASYRAETTRQAALAKRKAAWAGEFSFVNKVGNYYGFNKLTITNPDNPTFKEWSQFSNNSGRYSASTTNNVIPGEYKGIIMSEDSGWAERVISHTRNELNAATFNADYTELRVSYRNSQTGSATLVFKLNERSNPPVVVDQSNQVYKKTP